MKYFGVLALLAALTCLPSTTCAPARSTNSSHVQWHKKGSSFLIKLYKHLIATGSDLSQHGAKQIVGVYATIHKPVQTVSSANVVHLMCSLNGSTLSLNQSHLVELHISVEAKPGVQQGDCILALHDIKSNTEIVSKNIPCDTPSKLKLTVTSFAKKWTTNPSKNAGVSVQISTKVNSFPFSSLPFVNMSSRVEPPFYIFYL